MQEYAQELREKAKQKNEGQHKYHNRKSGPSLSFQIPAFFSLLLFFAPFFLYFFTEHLFYYPLISVITHLLFLCIMNYVFG